MFSGDPTRTTWGNTLRVVSYMEYTLSLAGIGYNDYRLFVAGDDVFLLLERCHLAAFEKAFWRVYSNEETGVYGLGQCAKKLDILPKNCMEFLSINGYY